MRLKHWHWALAFVAMIVSMSLVPPQAFATDDAPEDVAFAAAVAAAQAIAMVENPSPAAPKAQAPNRQPNTLSVLAHTLRSYPSGTWMFCGACIVILMVMAVLLFRAKTIPGCISNLTTPFFFWLGAGNLVFLLVVGVFYAIQRGADRPYMLGGMLPIAVPWFGALGAVTISLAGVFFYADAGWDKRYNYWHIGRPLFGAVLGVVAFFLFILILSSAGTKIPIFEQSPKPGAKEYIIYYVLAFLVGYREETFRELIQRVTDLILKPGNPAAPPSPSITFKEAGKVITTADFGNVVAGVGTPFTIDVENDGTGTLLSPTVHLDTTTPANFTITTNPFPSVSELKPKNSFQVVLTLLATAAGTTYNGALIVTGNNFPKGARLALTGTS
jgi:hypothetical protein